MTTEKTNTDSVTQAQLHYRMSKIRSKDTKPEIKLRHSLWRKGFRYKKCDKSLPGCPDIVLPKYKTIVFVHGCFWHGHKNCRHYTIPKTNTEFWVSKVKRNQKRDEEVWRHLEAQGWYVIIVWECELEKQIFDSTVRRVEQEIIANGKEFQRHKEERALYRRLRILEKLEKSKKMGTNKGSRVGSLLK